jgi:osmotically-inducible protein OsmY
MSTAAICPAPRVVDLLREKVSTAIKGNPYLQCRDLRFEASEGRVTLHGQVSSWYQKQMAQEMLMRMDGIDAVENRLEVHWTRQGYEI